MKFVHMVLCFSFSELQLLGSKWQYVRIEEQLRCVIVNIGLYSFYIVIGLVSFTYHTRFVPVN